MDAHEPYLSLLLALAAGLLVGFEREGAREPEEREQSFLGGSRTYPLVALTGAVATLLEPALGMWPLVLSFAAFFSLVAISYAQDVRRGDVGLTSETAFLLVFLLGCLSATRGLVGDAGQKALLVLAIAVVATLLLSVKPKLHALAARASKADVYATLKFLIVAVVVLPLLPNRAMGPLDALNPYAIGWMVVLIAGVGFVGYVATRVLGTGRGVAVTGLVGGLASSTAVTLSFAGRARAEPALGRICAPAVLLASTVMFVRLLVLIGIVHPPLLRTVGIPLLAAALGGVVAGGLLFRDAARKTAGADVRFENPFELSSAVKWGLVFTAVLFVAKAASTYLGPSGTYLAGFLAGATNAEAIALSMAGLDRAGQIAEAVAANTVVIGAAANTLAKLVLAAVIGRGALAKPLLPAFGGILAAGLLGYLLS
jgi:uncharacterized membrane protein (DUF4010 family)